MSRAASLGAGLLTGCFFLAGASHAAAQLVHAIAAGQLSAQAAGGHDFLFFFFVIHGTGTAHELNVVTHGRLLEVPQTVSGLWGGFEKGRIILILSISD
jgi:hypothetical protein